MNRTLKALPVALLLAGLLGACSSGGSDNADATTTTTAPTTTTTTSLDGEVDVDEFFSQLRDFEITDSLEADVTVENEGETIERTLTYVDEGTFSLWGDDFRAAFDETADSVLLCSPEQSVCRLRSFDAIDSDIDQARTSALIFTSTGIADLLEAEFEENDPTVTIERETRNQDDFDDAVCYVISERGQEDGEICIDPATGLTVLFDSGTGIVFTVQSVSDRLSGDEVGFEAPTGIDVVDLR